MRTITFLLWMVMASLLLVACKDDDMEVPEIDPGKENVVEIGAACNDHSYEVKANGPWKAEVSDEWVYLYQSSGDNSSKITFYAEENGEDEARNTTLKIKTDDGKETIVTIRQKGLAEDGSNALGEGIFQKHGVCWGYNGYGLYADANYLTEQIINEKKAVELMERYAPGEASVQTETYEKIESVESSGTSAQDMSESLGVKAGLESELPCGFSMGLKADYKSEDLANSSRNFSKRRHKAIKYRKTMAVYNLVGLMEEEPNTKEEILTFGFKAALKNLSKNLNNNTLKEFVRKYGTHVVVAAELGGCFDYCMTTDKSNVSSSMDITAGLDMGYKKMFAIKGDANYDKMNKKIGSNYSCKVTVIGGEASLLSAATNGEEGGCKNEDIVKWEESITNENALLIDHKLLPIWDVIPDENVKRKVEAYLTNGTYIEDVPLYALPEAVSDVTGAVKVELTDFMEEVERDNKSEKTLVYRVEASGSPIAEICHEYIPQLGNRRVFVAYPVIANSPDYTKGYFLGDGTRRPGTVTWSEGEGQKTYIYTADKDISEADVLKVLYIEGKDNIIVFSGKENTTVPKWSIGCIKPSYFKFYRTEDGEYGSKYNMHTYAIVKVGKRVWMRENLLSFIGVGWKYMSPRSYNGNYYYDPTSLDGLPKTQWEMPDINEFKELQAMTATGEPFVKEGSKTGFDLKALGYMDNNYDGRYDSDYYYLMGGDDIVIKVDIEGLEPMIEEKRKEKFYYPIRLVRSDNFMYE